MTKAKLVSGGDSGARTMLVDSGWQPFFADAKVHSLLNYLIAGDASEVLPVLDPEIGARYPDAEKISELGPLDTKDWLDDLSKNGLLTKKFVEKIIVCPSCKSPNAPVFYRCPHCKSIDIEKRALLEHSVCGTIDKDDNFRQGELLICPRCGKKLGEPGLTYRQVGTWFLCRECAKSFDRPQSLHRCRKCKNSFSIDEAVMVDVSSYSITKEAKESFRSGSLYLRPLRLVLEDFKYRVNIPGNLKGVSGNDHIFDLVAIRGEGTNELLVMDIYASGGVVDETPVIKMFAKKYDTNPKHSVILAIPAMNPKAKSLASLYHIEVLEAANAAEAVEKLRKLAGD